MELFEPNVDGFCRSLQYKTSVGLTYNSSLCQRHYKYEQPSQGYHQKDGKIAACLPCRY